MSNARARAGTPVPVVVNDDDLTVSPEEVPTRGNLLANVFGANLVPVDVLSIRTSDVWYPNPNNGLLLVSMRAASTNTSVGRVVLISNDGGATSIPLSTVKPGSGGSDGYTFVIPKGYDYMIVGDISAIVWIEFQEA